MINSIPPALRSTVIARKDEKKPEQPAGQVGPQEQSGQAHWRTDARTLAQQQKQQEQQQQQQQQM